MQSQSQVYSRHTPGRFLQSLTVGRDPMGARAYAQAQGHWADRQQLVRALETFEMTAVDVQTTDDHAYAQQPVSDAMSEALRPLLIADNLLGLRRVPPFSRIFVSADNAILAAEVAEGNPIPLLAGNWDVTTLELRKFAAIVVETRELVESTSPTASAAITSDLVAAVAEAENTAFVSPVLSGSVLYGATSIDATGTTAAAIKSDLARLFALVRGAGRGGLALVMHEGTASHMHFADPAAFPALGPEGGSIAGVRVFISDAADLQESPFQRIIGLINSSRIFYTDPRRIRLDVARNGAIAMSGVPASEPNQVSLLQTDSVALRAVRAAGWYARSGCGAYLRVDY